MALPSKRPQPSFPRCSTRMRTSRAKRRAPRLMREPVTQDYGGRDYTGKDPEGHVWTFGTYDPWAAH